jgi:hypothetical protein
MIHIYYRTWIFVKVFQKFGRRGFGRWNELDIGLPIIHHLRWWHGLGLGLSYHCNLLLKFQKFFAGYRRNFSYLILQGLKLLLSLEEVGIRLSGYALKLDYLFLQSIQRLFVLFFSLFLFLFDFLKHVIFRSRDYRRGCRGWQSRRSCLERLNLLL